MLTVWSVDLIDSSAECGVNDLARLRDRVFANIAHIFSVDGLVYQLSRTLANFVVNDLVRERAWLPQILVLTVWC